MANGFRFESPFNKLLNETVPSLLQSAIARQDRLQQLEQSRFDRLNEIERAQENFEQTRQDNLNFQNRQFNQQEDQQRYQRKLDRQNRLDFEEQMVLQNRERVKQENRELDSRLINLVNEAGSFTDRIKLANQFKNEVKDPLSVDTLDAIINKTETAAGFRQSEIKTLLDSGLINENAYNTLLRRSDQSDEASYQRVYSTIKSQVMQDISQDDELDLINLQEINKRLINLDKELNDAVQTDLAANNTEASDLVNQNIKALTIQKDALVEEIKSRKSPYSPTVKTDMQSVVRQKIARGDDFTGEDLRKYTPEQLKEIDSAIKEILPNATIVPEPLQSLSNIIIPQNRQTTIKVTAPSVTGVPQGLVGKEITPATLRRLIKIKEEFVPNPRAAQQGIFAQTTPKFEFLDVLARQLGFESAEALNTKEGYRALQSYYNE
tara:strand:- start:2200 stop:3507 length:1308 start_codon:yes stop_codon:yes gene_type:complete